MYEVAGIGGLILLGLTLWAVISIIGSNAGTGAKVLWCLFVIVLPVIGFIVWLIAGPRGAARTA
ncbi:PLD nuclease N-terminal domain-containing protein [Tateyamaria armeniaca]|uniref:PLD nuclease N-terminal domain-containing protein n=1 Tax=Tateyamaria armeniaca TaxID=2518930 RepID=A0ABW8UYB5_9RHOB